MTGKVVTFPEPPIDLADVYCGLVDANPDIDLKDPRLLSLMDAMSQEDAARTQEQLRAEAATKARRAEAVTRWLRRRVLRRDPSVIREIAPRARPAGLRILQGFIELDGQRIARLLPNLRLSLLDRLTEAFDAIEEDADTIAELEERLEMLAAGEEK
jgi:hypothetical protein